MRPPHGGASCCDSVIDDLHWSWRISSLRKARSLARPLPVKRLLPISDKRTAKED